ncbi:hypothetical protein SEA_GODONK_170 [Gordonia phage GodonK]|uniref:Uncharacterized protein n=1 Tax=Gordonia phage GodonK TaxID=2562192 RepID=A0A4D6E292_9CAUD|nr:hypothetical protein HOV33_gp198 [Gordonia phage GodonK]QBZ72758.1 hypothetical protein SEA_GODONK_170 [Gordonia phage GodonK]
MSDEVEMGTTLPDGTVVKFGTFNDDTGEMNVDVEAFKAACEERDRQVDEFMESPMYKDLIASIEAHKEGGK